MLLDVSIGRRRTHAEGRASFARSASWPIERFGLDLKRGKEALVAARLGKKLRQLGFQTFADYYRHVLADSTGEALIELIDALTTNHTSFLRERAHFEFLARAAQRGIPRGSHAARSGARPARAAKSPIRSPCVWRTLWREPAGARVPHPGHRHLDAGAGHRPARRLSGGAFRRMCRRPGGALICCGARANPRGSTRSSRSWRSGSSSSGST